MSKKILKGVANVATFGLAGALLGGKKKPKAEPAAASPTVMPTPDEEAIRMARRRSITSQLARRGRQSTILTGDKLGN